jgi:hypothetical protein
VLLSSFISVLFACCCLGSCLSNFKCRPLHHFIISPGLWYSYFEFQIFFLKWTLSEVSLVILQMRFWGSYIIYPFLLFRDTIFMVPSDYQIFIESKM